MITNLILKSKDVNRFYSKINKTDNDEECWTWRDYSSYGMFGLNGGTELAHRVAYANGYGEFDKKLCVLHKCDNPPCCNPKHLFLGTKADNTHDMFDKGRSGVAGNTWNRGEKCGGAKLTNAQVLEIRKRYTKGVITHAKLAEQYGVSRVAITYVLSRHTYKHI